MMAIMIFMILFYILIQIVSSSIKAQVNSMANLNPRQRCITKNNLFPQALKSLFFVIILSISFIALSSNAYAHGMDDQSDKPPPHWPYHALLVSLGLIFMTAGMLTARHKKGRRWWLKAHRTMGLFGASLAVLGVFLSAYLVSMYLEKLFVAETHAYLGIAAASFVIITPIVGFMQFRYRDKRIHVAHRWLGRTALVLMFANIIAGLQMILK